jgi:uncharacterized protein
MDTTSTRPLAVVTGASKGIGRELAKQFATHDFDLVVAADGPNIAGAASELEGLGAWVEAVQVDLATDAGVDELYARVTATGRPMRAVALNAGIGEGGAFASRDPEKASDLDDELRIVDLNVRSTVRLAKYAARDMVARGEGRLLFTSSIASTMPGSFQAVYNASKAFVQSFALALRDELKDSGVTVTALMPGPTDTAFFARAEMLATKVGAGPKDDPADVAADGFEALMEGKDKIVPGSLTTRLQGRTGRFIPDRAKAAMHRRMAEPGSARR